MFKNFSLRITNYALSIKKYSIRIEKILLILLALSVCISEPLSRNIIRVVFFMFAIKFFISNNAAMELIKRYKMFLLTISAFAWWMIISSIYGGHLVSDSDSNVYWFFFSHNMILFIPLIMMIRRQKNSDKLLITTAISLLIDDAFITFQLVTGIYNPTTFLNDSPFQSSILYVILLPTFLILTLSVEDFKKQIFYCITFFISLGTFLYLYTTYAQIVVAITLALVLIERLRACEKFLIGTIAAVIFVIMFQGALKYVPDFEIINVYDVFKGRDIVWENTFEIAVENPIMGVGLGNYKKIYDERFIDETPNLKITHAYNSYLQFWSETGILGLILFCVIFGSILIWSKKRAGNLYGRILFFATLALMLYSTTDFIFESYSAMRLYWVLFGICVASLDR